MKGTWVCGSGDRGQPCRLLECRCLDSGRSRCSRKRQSVPPRLRVEPDGRTGRPQRSPGQDRPAVQEPVSKRQFVVRIGWHRFSVGVGHEEIDDRHKIVFQPFCRELHGGAVLVVLFTGCDGKELQCHAL